MIGLDRFDRGVDINHNISVALHTMQNTIANHKQQLSTYS